MDTIALLDKLMKSLNPQAEEKEREAWWSDFVTIKYDLQQHPRTTKYESDLVYRAERSLSRFIADIRDGAPAPDKGSVQVDLNALRTSIAKRTTGIDGMPRA